MLFRSVIKKFEDGNVCVTGLRGRGKDMLMANVVVRRRKPYVSNVEYYPENHIEYNPKDYDIGGNTYRNFIEGTLKRYVYPHQDGTDLYISDVGVYFPSQYCNELNRDYKSVPTFSALSRHLGACNVHINVQNLNRAWDKLREMSDTYIACNGCFVLFGIVFQRITVYDMYDSCIRRIKPYQYKAPLLASKEMRQLDDMERMRYEQNYGKVRSHILIYRNKSSYDTRVFKTMLENAVDKLG